MSVAAAPAFGRRGPLRFLGVSVGGWVLARIVIVAVAAPTVALLPEAARTLHDLARRAPAAATPAPESRPVPARTAGIVAVSPRRGASAARPPHGAAADSASTVPSDLVARYGAALLLAAYNPGSEHAFPRIDAGQAEAFAAPPGGRAPLPGRWTAQAYLFARGGRARALAPGGQLGGSQVYLRIVRRIGDHAALALRVSAPARDLDGAEAALGVDWLPLGSLAPLRVSAERRIALGHDARNAWSAYVAGGFYRELDKALVVDGYAQAGIVGARRRDLFADGAVRAGRVVAVGPSEQLTLGAGAWGAAQPNVQRLDIGPRAAVSLPLGGGATGVLALEGRMRVAGAARPGSGLALTLATDF